jgi:hypothetical protein
LRLAKRITGAHVAKVKINPFAMAVTKVLNLCPSNSYPQNQRPFTSVVVSNQKMVCSVTVAIMPCKAN